MCPSMSFHCTSVLLITFNSNKLIIKIIKNNKFEKNQDDDEINVTK